MATTLPISLPNAHQIRIETLNRPNSLGKQEYAELYQLVKQRGLLDKQPGYYLYKTLFSLVLLAASLAVLITVQTLWVQLLNAAFMSVAFAQIAYLGHDSGHQQVFRTLRKNDAMLMMVNVLTGFDRSWWIDKHHRHHRRPNDEALDLDVNLPFFAFTDKQAASKWGIKRFVVKYQAFLLFPLMIFEGLSLRADGIQYLIKRKNVKFFTLELLATIAHLAVYFIVLFYLLGPWLATAFLLIHHMVLGVYMATVFAPNHKGMPIIENGARPDFLRQQVITARNIRGGPLVDFYYGGLNYQIEHHLFPNMPRNRLKKVRPIVREFCAAHDLPYHETGVIGAWKEILGSLHDVSGVLRGRKPQTASPEA